MTVLHDGKDLAIGSKEVVLVAWVLRHGCAQGPSLEARDADLGSTRPS